MSTRKIFTKYLFRRYSYVLRVLFFSLRSASGVSSRRRMHLVLKQHARLPANIKSEEVGAMFLSPYRTLFSSTAFGLLSTNR